jgi:hypothetical protein
MSNPTIGDNFADFGGDLRDDVARDVLRDMVRADLKAKGYNALFCHAADDCGCTIRDLMCCEFYSIDDGVGECEYAWTAKERMKDHE